MRGESAEFERRMRAEGYTGSYRMDKAEREEAAKQEKPSAENAELQSRFEQEPILQFFAWSHLPEHVQEVSKLFGCVAHDIVVTLPRNPERTVALRKLLEAKDAAVRAKLFK